MSTSRIMNQINHPFTVICATTGGGIGFAVGILLSIPAFHIENSEPFDYIMYTFGAIGALAGSRVGNKIDNSQIFSNNPAPALIETPAITEQKELAETKNELSERLIASHFQGDIPQRFICPITGTIMNHPVMASDGHNYEEWAIRKAMRIKMVSPISREELNPILYPNKDLRSDILEFTEEKERKHHLKR